MWSTAAAQGREQETSKARCMPNRVDSFVFRLVTQWKTLPCPDLSNGFMRPSFARLSFQSHCPAISTKRQLAHIHGSVQGHVSSERMWDTHSDSSVVCLENSQNRKKNERTKICDNGRVGGVFSFGGVQHIVFTLWTNRQPLSLCFILPKKILNPRERHPYEQ